MHLLNPNPTAPVSHQEYWARGLPTFLLRRRIKRLVDIGRDSRTFSQQRTLNAMQMALRWKTNGRNRQSRPLP